MVFMLIILLNFHYAVKFFVVGRLISVILLDEKLV